ncbi:MAG: cobalamin-dependent protein, partial [Leptolinea sp.]
MKLEELYQKLNQAVVEGDDVTATTLAKEALGLGIEPLEIVRLSIQPAMDLVGEQFQNGEAFLPELIIAGDAATAALNVILENMAAGGTSAIKGTVVLGVMYGDNHDIGKNLVKAMLAANGFRVIDAGVNVHPKAFIENAVKEHADIIAMSTLITTSIPYQREVIELLKAMGKRQDFFVIMGGGPIT